MVPGETTTCMAQACTLGKMVEDMKVNTTWTRNMAMEFISGLMEENIKGIGQRDDNMGKGSISCQMGLGRLVCGKMGRGLDGRSSMILILRGMNNIIDNSND